MMFYENQVNIDVAKLFTQEVLLAGSTYPLRSQFHTFPDPSKLSTLLDVYNQTLTFDLNWLTIISDWAGKLKSLGFYPQEGFFALDNFYLTKNKDLPLLPRSFDAVATIPDINPPLAFGPPEKATADDVARDKLENSFAHAVSAFALSCNELYEKSWL